MKKIYFLISLCLILTSLRAQNWSITQMAPMPVKISNNAVVEGFQNGQPFVYSFGGIDSTKVFSGISNRSFKYNVTTDIWDTIPDLPDPMTKIAAAASYVNGKIYIVGGYTVLSNGNEVSSNKIHIFDPVADTFLTDGAPIPIPIDDHVQCVYKDSLIYIVTGWSNTTNVNNVQIYDTYLNTWSVGTPVRFNLHRVFGSTGTIINDTIYYFGGAERSTNFPANNYLKKGAIDPLNPTQITWFWSIPNSAVFSYRPACTQVNGSVYWIGGSSVSYNYNGIAYNGSGGVAPSNWVITYQPNSNLFSTVTPSGGQLPMDLRGVASIDDTVKYIVGGMESNQQVGNKTLRLVYNNVPTNTKVIEKNWNLSVFPNPARNSIKFNGINEKSKLIIYNSIGEKVLIKNVRPNSNYIDVSQLKNGIYFASIIGNQKTQAVSFLVSR